MQTVEYDMTHALAAHARTPRDATARCSERSAGERLAYLGGASSATRRTNQSSSRSSRPHTSNWDFVVCVAAMFALDLKIRWLGKESLFRWPLSLLLHRLGGWPVRRDTPEGVVEQAAAIINVTAKIHPRPRPGGHTQSRDALANRLLPHRRGRADSDRAGCARLGTEGDHHSGSGRAHRRHVEGRRRLSWRSYHSRMAKFPASYWEPAA